MESSKHSSYILIIAAAVFVTFGIPVISGLSWFGPQHRASIAAFPTAADSYTFPNVDLPNRRFEADSLRRRAFPWWNPFVSLGLPFAEQYETQLFFPVELVEIF